MKIYCSEVNDMPIMRVLKEKFGAKFMFSKDFDPTAHELEVWHILRYLNHYFALTRDNYTPLGDFDGVEELSDAETRRIQNLMIEKIKKL